MMQVFQLQVASTGEKIIEGSSTFRMLVWQRKVQKKVLKSQKRAQRFKDAIQANDVAVAWISCDSYRTTVSLEEFTLECRRVFQGLEG